MDIFRTGTSTLYLSDTLNRAALGREGPRFILDADAIGLQLNPTAGYEAWLAEHAGHRLCALPGTLAELAQGREAACRDPGYAARVENAAMRSMDRLGHVVMPSLRLDMVSARLKASPDVRELVRSEGKRAGQAMRRLDVVGVAIAYGVIIASGNGFYRRLAKVTTLHEGVYDPYRGRWVVEPGLRPGRVRDRMPAAIPA